MASQGASTLQHIQTSSSSSTKKSNQMPIKSSLKRSKSFGSTDCSHGISNLIDFNLPTEHVVLIKRALDNPNNLITTQLMEIVSIICSKAMETSVNSYRLAKICITIADKDKNNLFLEALINCCREWFNERDKLIKMSSNSTHHPKQRWLAYIAFVSELYLNLKSKHRRVKLLLSGGKDSPQINDGNHFLDILPEENSDDEDNQERQDTTDEKDREERDDQSNYLFNLSYKQSQSLAMLLYDCCHAILTSLPTSGSTAIDIECLLNVLRSVGRFIEEDNVQRMDKIMFLIRETYVGPLATKLSTMSLKSLLELIECRSSRWQFNQAQQIYYFPYTKPS
ncbi:uncharacterized protein LOC107371188 isoform X2 [Tetranychus urticae]|uniref:uncharacterized protein LOC107371188 isoform X2 n=1 Tax=Tetranychus urticae TaxID=32264 RepID=UPI00077BDA40|nr:uncharacterized protein LOC107371188 isoform X2 [Tetranychus urticae]XP_025018529.1 uncharacterized protein LOC107371188 isoform X2 [Tetranychus urticae]